MWDQAPMPRLQHSVSWEELLSQLWHPIEIVGLPIRQARTSKSLAVRVWARFLRICRILVLHQSFFPLWSAGRYGCSVDNPGRSVSLSLRAVSCYLADPAVALCLGVRSLRLSGAVYVLPV